MIGARLGHGSDRLLRGIARRLDVNPNTLTVTGFFVTVVAGIVLSQDLFWGGALIICGGLFDMLDGAVARANGRTTLFGAYLDSVLDRYADAFLFFGAAWYLRDNPTGVVLSLGTLAGAFLISYARARAEGLGTECGGGLMERPERVVLLAIGALTGWLVPVLWLMLPLTHFTVFQRIYHVRKVMSLKGGKDG